MTYTSLQTIQKMLRSVTFLTVTAVIVCGVGLSVPAMPAHAQASATYSCGAYSGGSYSHSGGSPDCAGDGTNVTPPNTGFAQLLQPGNLAAIIGSLIVLGIGVGIILKLRKQRS